MEDLDADVWDNVQLLQNVIQWNVETENAHYPILNNPN